MSPTSPSPAVPRQSEPSPLPSGEGELTPRNDTDPKYGLWKLRGSESPAPKALSPKGSSGAESPASERHQNYGNSPAAQIRGIADQLENERHELSVAAMDGRTLYVKHRAERRLAELRRELLDVANRMDRVGGGR